MQRSTLLSRYGFIFGSIILIGCGCLLQQVGLAGSFLRWSTLLKERENRYSVEANDSNRTLPRPSSNESVSVLETLEDVPFIPTVNRTDPPHPQFSNADRAKKMPSSSFSQQRQATIIVQLSGEMANNLQHIAHGLGLQQLAKDEFDVDCNIILRHHEGPNNRAPQPKWKSARDNIQNCFPLLADWSFTQGNNKKEFHQRHTLQETWLGDKMHRMFGLINSGSLSNVRQGLEILANEVLTDPDRPSVEIESSPAFRIPYLFSETLDVFPMVDLYYDHIRELMRFNDTACCAKIPGPDESVFHFRNYESEMPERRAYDMGFAELSPSKVSNELFRHLRTGDRVSITTRIFNQRARNYAEALAAERSVNATVITDQSAVEDFCFLKRAQKEVVGSARSTFVFWAAVLGNASRARLYHVDNQGLRQRHPNFWERFSYNFTHPGLHDRLSFELYHAEE